MNSTPDNLSWSTFQVGARENYAIPRSLVAIGDSVNLYTDFWYRGSLSAKWLPKSLVDRCHADLYKATVISSNSACLLNEARLKLVHREPWARMETRNQWFQDVMSRRFLDDVNGSRPPQVVFAYSYAARKVFEIGRNSGCITVLGQCDPGPLEFEILERLHARYDLPNLHKPSAEYWANWRYECDLADHILVNSEWSRNALVNAGIDRKKISVIPLVYEGSRDTGPKNREGEIAGFNRRRPLRVLFLGQVLVRKGVVELVEAILKLKDAPIEWLFVGGGDLHLLEKVRDLPSVHVIGPVNRSSVGHFYRHADVFILPTHSDGFGLTQLEAASYGLPIVVSRNCGEVVQHGINGEILGSVSAGAIQATISKLLSEPELISRYSCRSRDRMHEFDLGAVGKALHDVVPTRERTGDDS